MSQQINLFNPAFRKEKKHFSAVTMLQALAALCVGAAAIYAWEAHQNRRLERVLAETDRQVSAHRDRMVGLSKEFSSKGRSDELSRVEERLRMRRELLNELQSGAGGTTQGFSPYLAALARRTTQGVWLTGVEIGGKASDIVIRGRVLDSELVPAYIRSLNREEPFAGRAVNELRLAAKDGAPQQKGPRHYVEFSMSMPLKGPS
jgi:type IV pilus assembly PilN-like protein